MGVKVVSLFSGIEVGKMALDKLGIEIDTFYSAEINKYALMVSKARHPDIIHLGDVSNWQSWDIDWSEIDIFMAAPPCQSFSTVRMQKIKELTETDALQNLSIITSRILKHILSVNPNVKFLIENVKSTNTNMKLLDELFGVEHVIVDSRYYSAQLRTRAYWTNLEYHHRPQDHSLSDVIESGWVDREKAVCCTKSYMYERGLPTLTKYLIRHQHQIVFGTGDGPTTNKVSKTQTKNADKVIVLKGVARTLGEWAKVALDGKLPYRSLTVLEYERLQTLPDDYTKVKGVSKTQRYRMIGNAWTLNVIVNWFTVKNDTVQ